MQKYNLNDLIEFNSNRFNPKVLINENGRRLMLISMRAGHSISEHATSGHVMLQVFQGHITFFENDRACDLHSGEMVTIEPGEKHRLNAQTDSVLLVTVTETSAAAPKDESETLDLREVPRPMRHPMIFAKFDALPVGGVLRLVNDHDPIPLNRQFEMIRHGQARWEYEERGPQLYRICITRIATPSPADSPLSAPAEKVQLQT